MDDRLAAAVIASATVTERSASPPARAVENSEELVLPPLPEAVDLTQPKLDAAAAEDSDGPEWPDEAVESAMRAEQREREGDLPAPTKTMPSAGDIISATPENAPPLPKLDTLIEQIPTHVRDTLEELFRARFTKVQRVPKSALK